MPLGRRPTETLVAGYERRDNPNVEDGLIFERAVGLLLSGERDDARAAKRVLCAAVHGVLVRQYPLGQEPDTDLSGGTVKALALRVNVTANMNVLAYMRFGIGVKR
jgi:hypothetical protein